MNEEFILNQPPIVEAITHWCSPIEYYALLCCLPEHQHKKYPTFYSVVLKRLEEALLAWSNNKELTRVLIIALCTKPNICLSGGFLLSVLQGERVSSDQDLDFIVGGISLEDRSNPVFMERAFPLITKIQLIMDITSVELSGSDYGSLEAPTLYAMVAPTGQKFQFILHETVEQAFSHPKQFDFAFCANYISSTKIVMCNYQSIISRRCTVSAFAYTSRMYDEYNGPTHVKERLIKYKQRGYDIRITYDPEKLEENCVVPEFEMSKYDRDDYEGPKLLCPCTGKGDEEKRIGFGWRQTVEYILCDCPTHSEWHKRVYNSMFNRKRKKRADLWRIAWNDMLYRIKDDEYRINA